MSFDLKLIVPDEAQTAETIRRCKGYMEIKGDQFNVRPLSMAKNALERFNADGEFLLYARLQNELFDEIGEDRLQELCGPEDNLKCRLREDDLREFVIELRSAVKSVSAATEGDPPNWELTAESQSLALCEFAYCNGYEIEMTPG